MLTDNGKEPKTSSANEEIFSPREMEARGKRLKAEGKMPPLAEVLKIVREVTQE
jgi:hypothetical protein